MRYVALCVLTWALPAVAAAASDAALLRLFLSDGTALVSYGEFARVDDRVIFSMPVGGTAAEPRLHVVSIPVSAVDWARTDRYSDSARYQHYATTRGETDFMQLSGDVARVLNDVALSTEPARALEIAMQARKTLAEWPQAHYGYRQKDVREIVGLLDEAISDLRAAAGIGAFDLSFVAMAAEVPLEPLLGMPSPREMIDQLLAVARLSDRSAERLSLLQSALAALDDAGSAIVAADATKLRETITAQIREEQAIDERYKRLSTRLLSAATTAAARARVRDVEAVLARIRREDARLGSRRPDVVQALSASVRAHLEAARQLRLMRDQWQLRRAVYRDYQGLVKGQLLQLVKAQPALDAIKRLAGPTPAMLTSLRARFDGGSERMQRMAVANDVRDVHELLVGAWGFAENAIRVRQEAIASGDLQTAWRASSAAAGALMMLSRAQEEIRALLEPPQLR